MFAVRRTSPVGTRPEAAFTAGATSRTGGNTLLPADLVERAGAAFSREGAGAAFAGERVGAVFAVFAAERAGPALAEERPGAG